jgi:hypothetical protein
MDLTGRLDLGWTSSGPHFAKVHTPSRAIAWHFRSRRSTTTMNFPIKRTPMATAGSSAGGVRVWMLSTLKNGARIGGEGRRQWHQWEDPLAETRYVLYKRL